jgi:hypothetical protein
MSQLSFQHSFASGELAPALFARTDLAKYHVSAALLSNFFVDYRGGASTRPGTKYIIQARDSANPVRLIRFAASSTVQYVLEFGEFYMRPLYNGSPILETAVALTAATSANPAVFTKAGHGFVNGDWVYATLFAGGTWGTNMNARYFIVTGVAGNDFSLTDLFGNSWSSVGFGTWSAGSFQRLYTIPSPYAAADLAILKFAQNVNFMEFTHPSYPAYTLTLISALSWVFATNQYGSTVTSPAAPTITTTLGSGTVNYAYIVTALDSNNQESVGSTAGVLANILDLRTVAGTNTVTWAAVSGAQSYNVYKAELRYGAAVPAGAAYGYIGNVTGVVLHDSNIDPDFSITPPIARNPFQGASVSSATVTNPGSYGSATAVPTVTIAAAPAGGVTATASAILGAISAAVAVSGAGWAIGDTLIVSPTPTLYGSVQFRVATVAGSTITGVTVLNPGSITAGVTPTNPVSFVKLGGGPFGQIATLNITWGVIAVNIISGGAGYTSVPAVSFSGGGAAATAVLGTASAGNPSVCAFWQQRNVLAGPLGSPQQINLSVVGAYYNFNVHFPVLPQDAIQYTIVSTELNQIKALITMPTGLICFGDRMAWLINGGAGNAPIEPDTIVANSQAYNGSSDVPPIVANQDILYVQAKGSIVRSLTYNFYTNIFTGVDITILSSHLFYGYTIPEWAWAEEPFKLVWAVRSDGKCLTCTYVKEQEMVGWAHHETDGLFKSVCTVVETEDVGRVDAIYFVVERTIDGDTVKYIERLASRYFPNGAVDAWCVDSGLQYDGAPATNFSGGEHLVGETCVGLADGIPITPFVMATNGRFTLPTAASVVTVGLAFLPELQTLPLDIGEPTAQGKMKKIANVDLMVQDTLGLEIGMESTNTVPMKDLVLANVGSMTNAVVTDLVTGQARTIITAAWTVPGQYYIKQPQPLPASILGVLPSIVIGDTR